MKEYVYVYYCYCFGEDTETVRQCIMEYAYMDMLVKEGIIDVIKIE